MKGRVPGDEQVPTSFSDLSILKENGDEYGVREKWDGEEYGVVDGNGEE